MSIEIDYFFNFPKSLDELAADLRLWVGCELRPYEGDPDDLYCRLLGMEFSLGTHRLERDGELDYGNYRYRIGIRTPIPDADFRPHQLLTMATLVYAMHRRLGVTGMLVFDIGRLLARYEHRTDPSSGEPVLYDEVSAEPVTFPRHFASLLERMPEEALGGAWEAPTLEYLRGIGRNLRTPRP